MNTCLRQMRKERETMDEQKKAWLREIGAAHRLLHIIYSPPDYLSCPAGNQPNSRGSRRFWRN